MFEYLYDMYDTEIEKSKQYVVIELVDYNSNTVTSKTIFSKATGNVNLMAFDSGKTLPEIISAFDAFIQIIEGSAEIVIDKHSNLLRAGESIIIPAHTTYFINAPNRFKMISTVIKSGYEGNTI